MGLKEDLIEIISAIYGIPGQYWLAGYISLEFWKAMKDVNPYSWIMLLLATICFILDPLSLYFAWDRITTRIGNFFENLFG
jgi:hypothetical protein